MATVHEALRVSPAAQPIRVPKRRHRIRMTVYALIVLVVLAGGGAGWEAWSYSSQLIEVNPHRPSYDIPVLAVHGNTVTLAANSRTARVGAYGIDWPGGRIVIGPIVSKTANAVVRTFTGNARTLRAGMRVDFDVPVYATPAAFGLSYRTVNVPGPLGPMPAWYIPGKRNTWAVMVHGWRANRADPLRFVPALVGLGLPVLDMTYRNDIGAPQSADHLYHLGATEWQDVQAGVAYALAHGARNVVLYGVSTGGGIVQYFMRHSWYAGRVRAVVLDSPTLDWAGVINWHAQQSSLPGIFKDIETPLIKRVIAWRLGLWDLSSLNNVQSASTLRVPTLIFHGGADTNAPHAPSAQLAKARPDIVTYYQVAQAEHTASWNVNPSSYTARLQSFLTRVAL